MLGFINLEHLPVAENEFPGISEFYFSLEEKPMTFLELVWLYHKAISEIPLRRRLVPESASAYAQASGRYL